MVPALVVVALTPLIPPDVSAAFSLVVTDGMRPRPRAVPKEALPVRLMNARRVINVMFIACLLFGRLGCITILC